MQRCPSLRVSCVRRRTSPRSRPGRTCALLTRPHVTSRLTRSCAHGAVGKCLLCRLGWRHASAPVHCVHAAPCRAAQPRLTPTKTLFSCRPSGTSSAAVRGAQASLQCTFRPCGTLRELARLLQVRPGLWQPVRLHWRGARLHNAHAAQRGAPDADAVGGPRAHPARGASCCPLRWALLQCIPRLSCSWEAGLAPCEDCLPLAAGTTSTASLSGWPAWSAGARPTHPAQAHWADEPSTGVGEAQLAAVCQLPKDQAASSSHLAVCQRLHQEADAGACACAGLLTCWRTAASCGAWWAACLRGCLAGSVS